MFCVLIFLLWKPFVPTVTESWFVIFIVRTFSKTIYGSFVLNFCIYKKQKLKKGKCENRWRCLSVTSSGDSAETHVSNPSVFLTNELSTEHSQSSPPPPTDQSCTEPNKAHVVGSMETVQQESGRHTEVSQNNPALLSFCWTSPWSTRHHVSDVKTENWFLPGQLCAKE